MDYNSNQNYYSLHHLDTFVQSDFESTKTHIEYQTQSVSSKSDNRCLDFDPQKIQTSKNMSSKKKKKERNKTIDTRGKNEMLQMNIGTSKISVDNILHRLPRTLIIKKKFINEYTLLYFSFLYNTDAWIYAPGNTKMIESPVVKWDKKNVKAQNKDAHYSRNTLQYLQHIQIPLRNTLKHNSHHVRSACGRLNDFEYTRKKCFQHNLPLYIDISFPSIVVSSINDVPNLVFEQLDRFQETATTISLFFTFQCECQDDIGSNQCDWCMYLRESLLLRILKSNTIIKLSRLRALSIPTFTLIKKNSNSISKFIDKLISVAFSRIYKLECIHFPNLLAYVINENTINEICEIIEKVAHSRYISKTKQLNLTFKIFSAICIGDSYTELVKQLLRRVNGLIQDLPNDTPLIVVFDISNFWMRTDSEEWRNLTEDCKFIKHIDMPITMHNFLPGCLKTGPSNLKVARAIQVSHRPVLYNYERYRDSGLI